jgi:hypothetical protein
LEYVIITIRTTTRFPLFALKILAPMLGLILALAGCSRTPDAAKMSFDVASATLDRAKSQERTIQPGRYAIFQYTNFQNGASQVNWKPAFSFASMAECRATIPAFIRWDIEPYNLNGQTNAKITSNTQYSVISPNYEPRIYTHACGKLNAAGGLVADAEFEPPEKPDWPLF